MEKFDFRHKIESMRGCIAPKTAENNNRNDFFLDANGNECLDQQGLFLTTLEQENQKAIRSGSDIILKKLDIGGFPKDERSFMLNYNYLDFLPNGMDPNSFKWVILTGDKGTGKTTLADRLAVEWMRQQPSYIASFISISEYLHDVKKFDGQQIKFGSISKFVVLDDFDKVKFTSFVIDELFYLVDYLYRNDRFVIITMNKPLKLIYEEVKKAGINTQNFLTLADRIKGRVGKNFKFFKGESFRQNQSDQFEF